eukprot:4715309-Alexandrium_andersonii.AAC.1
MISSPARCRRCSLRVAPSHFGGSASCSIVRGRPFDRPVALPSCHPLPLSCATGGHVATNPCVPLAYGHC